MAGQSRKWPVSPQANWPPIQWGDGHTFRVDLEGQDLGDDDMEEWGHHMEAEIDKRVGKKKVRLTATALNFQKNDLGSAGVLHIIDLLQRRNIGAHSIKFHKNRIGDEGAYAIGQFIARSNQPVHEVHLSHNCISERGACSFMEAVARCQKYPYPAGTGKRDASGNCPIWVRFEHNLVQWSVIERRLSHTNVRWCIADSRDAWLPKDRAPMMCLHNSYMTQNGVTSVSKDSEHVDSSSTFLSTPGMTDGQNILAALQGGDHSASRQRAHSGDVHFGLGQETGGKVNLLAALQAADNVETIEAEILSQVEEMPLYVFLDASAVLCMLVDESRPFSFKSLLNLCRQGNMDCNPNPENESPDEHNRIVLVITDSVLEELNERVEPLHQDQKERKRVGWFQNSQDSYVHPCRKYGILETLETKQHNRLVKVLPQHSKAASSMQVSEKSLRLYDFSLLWASQIVTDGKVLLLTASAAMKRFGDMMKSDREWHAVAGAPLLIVHMDDLERTFSASSQGEALCKLASSDQSSAKCDAPLTASLISNILDIPGQLGILNRSSLMSYRNCDEARQRGEHILGVISVGSSENHSDNSQSLQRELGEAVNLFADVRDRITSVSSSSSAGNDKVVSFLERLEGAQQRWQALLSSSGGNTHVAATASSGHTTANGVSTKQDEVLFQ